MIGCNICHHKSVCDWDRWRVFLCVLKDEVEQKLTCTFSRDRWTEIDIWMLGILSL